MKKKEEIVKEALLADDDSDISISEQKCSLCGGTGKLLVGERKKKRIQGVQIA